MSKRILLFPLPKAMRGGEHHPEQIARLQTTYDLWLDYVYNYGYDVKILCSSGLPNSQNVTLGDTLKEEILEISRNSVNSGFPELPEGDIIVRDDISTHTGQNVREVREFCLSGWDEIDCITTPGIDILGVTILPGHTNRVKRLMYNTIPEANVRVIPAMGIPLAQRLRRAPIEALLIFELLFDPQAYFLDRSGENRITASRSKP